MWFEPPLKKGCSLTDMPLMYGEHTHLILNKRYPVEFRHGNWYVLLKGCCCGQHHGLILDNHLKHDLETRHGVVFDEQSNTIEIPEPPTIKWRK